MWESPEMSDFSSNLDFFNVQNYLLHQWSVQNSFIGANPDFYRKKTRFKGLYFFSLTFWKSELFFYF